MDDIPYVTDEDIEARVLGEVGEHRWQAFSEAARRHHRDKARRELVQEAMERQPAPEDAAAQERGPVCQCWNEGQYGRVHREDCPIHGPSRVVGAHFATGGEISVPQMRRQAVADLMNLVEISAGTSDNLVALSDYEVVNLLSALQACGYGAADTKSPLVVLHSGDWLGQIVQKLQSLAVEAPHGPNRTPQEYARMANRWPRPA